MQLVVCITFLVPCPRPSYTRSRSSFLPFPIFVLFLENN